MKTALLRISLFLVFVQVPGVGLAFQPDAVAVLISREITPYIQMVNGFETHLRGRKVRRFFLDAQGRPYSLVASTPDLKPESYAALVAVGPEALRYLQSRAWNVPLFYAMILNPENVIDPDLPPPCGVSLNLPVQAQIQAIKKAIPPIRRLGVLFDPANNAPWFDKARKIAANMHIELLPLQVEFRQGRISIIGNYASLDALLFIPDKSVISKAIIRHVIKQAAARGVPVVGYNSFFYTSGAAVVFIIDYTQVGEQTASLVKQTLEGKFCAGSIPPNFAVRVNPIVFESLKQYSD